MMRKGNSMNSEIGVLDGGIKMKKSNELERDGGIFRARSEEVAEAVGCSPLTEVQDFRRLQVISMIGPNESDLDYLSPKANNYEENKKVTFKLMNIKIVIYGLSGLVCEREPTKQKKFGKKKNPPTNGNIPQSEIKNEQELDTTTAVVSCRRNGTSIDTSMETHLPSLPLGHPIATSVNKVNYAASWPSDQSTLHQEDGAKERSAFDITRCMKQASFTPGIGAGSNYCHQTLEVGINISRGTELIRLGTALIAINGEEEGEVTMNVPTIPLPFKRRKRKKTNKYGYFTNDPYRRFFLDNNSVLKIGVQVIPEEAIRLARKKDEDRTRKESQLHELLEDDNFAQLSSEAIRMNDLTMDPEIATNVLLSDRKEPSNPLLQNFLCGSIPTAWVPNFLKSTDSGSKIPMEIITDNNLDQLAIHTLISSVSESTDGSDDIFEDYAGEL